MQKKITFVGAELGWGARWPEVELGPKVIKEANLLKSLPFSEAVFLKSSLSAITSEKKTYEERLSIIEDFSKRLADLLEKICRVKQMPLVVGGDHATAIGTWQGIKSGHRLDNMGLLWIDAHLDAHTPDTTMTHNIHGMPLAVLLGAGEPSLTAIKGKSPTLLPQNVAMIGVRSAEPGETELIHSMGVRVFSMNEIEARGIEEVMIEAQSIITDGTDGFGISLDIDAFDPRFAPGTGTPEANGLDPTTLTPLLSILAKSPEFCGLEIAEFNPKRDDAQQTTLKLMEYLMKTILFE